MHDDQVEDRLRAILRAEGDGLPLTITPEELERRLALRRRERSGRRLGLLAAGLAVIAVGSLVATTAGWVRIPAMGDPVASTEPTETPHESFGPAGTPIPGIAPLVAIPGRKELIRIDPAPPDDGVEGTASSATGSDAVVVSMRCIGDGNLVLTLGGEAQRLGCSGAGPSSINSAWFDVRDLVIDVQFTTTGRISFAILVEQPGKGETQPAGEPICEQLDPSQSSGPPVVGAGLIPGDSIQYGGVTNAHEWDRQTVGHPGSWEDVPTDLQMVADPSVESIEFLSDQCLYDVRAEALLTNTRGPEPAPIPLTIRRGIGTRAVDVEPPQVGVWLVRVRASFATSDGSPGWSETTFRLIVRFDTPRLTINAGPSGGTATAEGACASYELASGAQASDSCGAPYSPLDGVEPVSIRSGDPVELELADGWRMHQVKVTAVDSDLVRAGAVAPEYSVAFRDDGGDRLSVPVVLDRGTWIVRVSLTGGRGNDTFGAHYDLPLVVRE